MSNVKTSVLDVANWFLSIESMTHKKLQKLCYYTQAWGYALLGCKLIDTSFQAWVHGPVSPTLYQKYKTYFWQDIPKLTTFTPENPEFFNNHKIEDLLNSVWFTYGDKTGNELEALTHSETPWVNARERAKVKEDEQSKRIILAKDMRDFYRTIYLGD